MTVFPESFLESLGISVLVAISVSASRSSPRSEQTHG